MKINRGFIENLVIIIVLSIMVAFSAFLGRSYKEINVFKIGGLNNIISNTSKYKNILVMGMAGFESHGPLLTDVMMVVNINLTNSKIRVVSIPRDLLVSVPKTNNYSKINNLLTLDNPKLKIQKTDLIKNKVEEITGLKIDNTVIIDLDGFRYFIDAISGVNVYVEKDVYDPKLSNPDNPNERFYLPAGWNYLDGKKAAKFIRSRYAASGDFARIDHQHDLLLAVFQKLKQLNCFTNPVLLYKIYNSWGGYLYTDINIAEAIKYLPIAKGMNANNILFTTISYEKPEPLLISQSSDIYGYYLMPKKGLDDYSEIQNFIYNFIYLNYGNKKS